MSGDPADEWMKCTYVMNEVLASVCRPRARKVLSRYTETWFTGTTTEFESDRLHVAGLKYSSAFDWSRTGDRGGESGAALLILPKKTRYMRRKKKVKHSLGLPEQVRNVQTRGALRQTAIQVSANIPMYLLHFVARLNW